MKPTIDIDFKMKYPLAKSVHDKWSQYEDKLLFILKTKVPNAFVSKALKDVANQNEEAKVLSILWYIHHLFPPQQKASTTKDGAKIRKKFSIADSQNGFAVLAQNTEELEAKIKLMQLQGRNIQPKLLIVGDFPSAKKIFVYLDGYRYPFLTILTALDVLFQMFFVFNLQFPEESEVFYNFLQSVFYEIPSEKKYVKVSTFKHDLNEIKI